MENFDSKVYWIALNMVHGIGAITFRKLMNTFGHPQQVFSASRHQLKHIPGISDKIAQNILDFQFDERVQRELEAIEKHQIHVLNWEDDAYPDQLKTIFDPPPILYVKGHVFHPDELMIAVVGSRQSSSYGRSVAENLCRELAVKGITVVSGMARGIDSFAHRGVLKAGGRTIAVLGCGVDVVYPPENTTLYQSILENGAIISEFPMHTLPDRWNFPARNRIISGICIGTIVVEAGIRSGALITADMALEQGREVLAVPGNITSATSQGTNRLIKQGAALVEHVEDVFNELSIEIGREIGNTLQREFSFPNTAPLPPLTPEEQQVYAVMETQPVHIDDITARSKLPSGKVSATLMMLEMKNVIRQLAGKMFVRI